MRILHLASTLGPTGSAQHLTLVAPILSTNGVEQRVVNLGESRPFAERLPAVHSIRFRGPLDLATLLALRRVATDFRPDVLHVWGNVAAVAANAIRVPFLKQPAAVVASDVSATNFLAARTVKAARVVRHSEPLLDPTPYPAVAVGSLGLPEKGRIILTVGGFDAAADPRMAVSAFDIIKYTIPDIHLAMVGTGPDRARVEQLARAVGFEDFRTHFLGVRIDVPAILKLATVVLVTHLVGGRGIALAARHARVPVVAWNTPELASVLADGVNAILVPVGDRAALASALYRVLTTPDLASQLRTGSPDPPSPPSVEEAAEQWAKIYRSL